MFSQLQLARVDNLTICHSRYQGFGRENDGNPGRLIGSNLNIFCYKEFEKFVLCKFFSKLEVIFIVYSEPVESRYVKNDFL